MYSSLGCCVIAIDIEDGKLARARKLGAHAVINSSNMDIKEFRNVVSETVKREYGRMWGWKIFEMSGHPRGQEYAFSLVRHASLIMVVGFTSESITIRLSNLMAFDAEARGIWGCPSELYPEILEFIEEANIPWDELVEDHPMDEINHWFEKARDHAISKRIILRP